MARSVALFLVLVGLALGVMAAPAFRNHILQRQKNAGPSHADAAAPPYNTYYFTQTLDHFSFHSDTTFQQRYLISDQFWNTNGTLSNGCPGPVLFYTGNEGDIAWFYNNTGFVTNVLGPQLGGLIVFAEHRYYGDSLPFGSKSFDPNNVVYLTSEQALADYAILIENLRNTIPGAAKCPFIAFGGSYGGMLSSWFRIKYPHIVAGALAASAPIVQFFGTGVSEYVFNEISTTDYTQAAPGCSSQIQQALYQVPKLGSTASGRQSLVNTFRLCGSLNNEDDVVSFYQWVSSSLTNMAMVDYPYPANFLAPLPGWPVNVSCSYMTANTNPSTQMTRLAQVTNLFYNLTGQAGTCNDLSNSGSPDLGDLGWSYQACSEMVMPIASNGKTDMFIPYPYNLTDYSAYCKQVWGAIPRAGWVPTYYGGFNITTATNIVFSNGQLDPWRGGGIQSTKGLDPSIVAVIIEHGAHHLDLRTPNPADPASVVTARQIEIQNIQKWINQYVSTHP